ncbi:Butyrophilin subfamily 2 member A2 [Dissostichus eleginoides]|uniref:Butyrophilin subfamily 2 member A2 n=1 Tax=Dissostichus eleginoides TaxID=100907 RepID=A0AAD9BTU7_DISEL|nr:Butyrophilin subfamily 2 member A2 [Dissostichus eleginoides]
MEPGVSGKKPRNDDVPQSKALQGRDPKGFRGQESREDDDNVQDAAVGEDVTLDCHVGSDLISSIKSVEWRFNHGVNVLVYRSKDFSLDDQGKQFRGRASGGDSWDFKTGKLPVKIKPLQESDAGIYSCYVSTGKDPKEFLSIKLNVNEAGDKDKQAKDQTVREETKKRAKKEKIIGINTASK